MVVLWVLIALGVGFLGGLGVMWYFGVHRKKLFSDVT